MVTAEKEYTTEDATQMKRRRQLQALGLFLLTHTSREVYEEHFSKVQATIFHDFSGIMRAMEADMDGAPTSEKIHADTFSPWTMSMARGTFSDGV
jgi:hypothetical protein